MNYLVDEILNENDEVKITKLLEIIPSKGPFSKRLKEALRIIQQQKNNEEVSSPKKILQFLFSLAFSCSPYFLFLSMFRKMTIVENF